MKDNLVINKSKYFAIRVINLYKYLKEEKKEFVLSKQLLRCGTSIGANIREGNVAISKAEFVSKMNIALKEASEAEYWLELLHETNYLSNDEFKSIYEDCNEINRILTKIIKSANSTNLEKP